uniref:Protein kinase domain-containing protein n=1 Tax=Heterorhabditis bacteriophora TaxID=37862 RepID=A0A1I7X856_HETBA
MQTADGFGLDNGPPVSSGLPAGSRLAKYLGGNRTGGSSGTNQMNTSVPSFVPHFAQMNINDAHNHPPPSLQAVRTHLYKIKYIQHINKSLSHHIIMKMYLFSGKMNLSGGAKLSSPLSTPSLGAGVIESQLWSYVIQLSSALRAVHASGLAARCIDLSKILVHGKNKVRPGFFLIMITFDVLLGSCGIADIVSPDHQPVQQQQMEDLHALGRVLLALATGNAFAARRDLVQQSMAYVNSHYSGDMKNLIRYL